MKLKKAVIILIITGVCWIYFFTKHSKHVDQVEAKGQIDNLRKEIQLLKKEMQQKSAEQKYAEVVKSEHKSNGKLEKSVTTSIDRSVTELLRETGSKKVDVNATPPQLFHPAVQAGRGYPSLEDDRMVKQLYYGQEEERQNRNISITVVVDGGWPWDEREFAGNCHSQTQPYAYFFNQSR